MRALVRTLSGVVGIFCGALASGQRCEHIKLSPLTRSQQSPKVLVDRVFGEIRKLGRANRTPTHRIMNRNLEIGQGESWGSRSGNLGLLLNLYFRRNEKAVANSAVMQEVASFRVGGHTLRTAFSSFFGTTDASIRVRIHVRPLWIGSFAFAASRSDAK